MKNIFYYKSKRRIESDLQKSKLAEIEIGISQQNELYRALYEMLSSGMPLENDSFIKDYVREGYEGNPDLFSIVMKLAGMFASVPLKLKEIKNGKEEDAENANIQRLMTNTNYYQTWNEFKLTWAVFSYVTGNSIVYAPKFEGGINQGKIDNDGLLMVPAQNVTIISGGFRKPIDKYVLDIDQTYGLAAENIWHERFAPTLKYEGGANFMGTSPIKVARNIINSQNKGYEVTAKMYAYGHPPGIISKETDGGDTTTEQEANFRKTYRRKYQGIDNMTVPIFTLGKLSYTKIGYDNLKELEVISMSEHGRRVFCNLLQCPSELFNDTAAKTYNSQLLAEKSIYTHRIIPDLTSFCEGFTELIQPYGNYVLRPDYSDIEALQDDKEKKSKWVAVGVGIGAYSPNEYREKMGDSPVDDPEMDVRRTSANMMPIGEDIEDENIVVDNSDKYYQDNKIELEM
jgi:HK97 family phage portal protein